MMYFYFFLTIFIGFLVELSIITYLCNRHLNGKIVLKRLTRFNESLADYYEVMITYVNWRFEKIFR